jgi:Domain of unknown function (DUF6468)
MPGMEWLLELFLIVLLAATLFHAVRLERALGVLKRDRATLEALVSGFNTSTRQAEAGVERLRTAADGAGRQLARQIDSAIALKDDLAYLTERGERLADRLDSLVRSARPMAAEPQRPAAMSEPEPAEAPRVRSQAERDLLRALRMAR